MGIVISGNKNLKFIKAVYYQPVIPPPPPEQKYLTFEALEDGLQIKLSTNDCQYSLNGKDWVDLVKATNTPSINTGERIYFKGNLTPAKSAGIGTFTISKKCNILGNCNSMLFGDDAETNLSLSGKSHALYKLFSYCPTIIDASQLILPATTLDTYCYYGMFEYCSSLVSAPALPATTLANYCYNSMFQGCTSLVTTPTLPATTLATGCYGTMFYNCTSLTTAPSILPATTLANSCYYNMFWKCYSLTQAPELPATTLADKCYINMFRDCTKLNYIKALFTTTPSSSYTTNWVSGVSSTGTFIKNANATWNVNGVNGIPTGWTVQTA